MLYHNVVLLSWACLLTTQTGSVRLEPRRGQCAAYNGRVIAGYLIDDWTPSLNVRQSCQLTCHSKARRLTYSFGKVRDGAKCQQSASKVCLNGRCTVIGCDRKIGSTSVRDTCGVCAGTNDTCKRIRRIDIIDRKRRNGKNSVVTIPAKSTNIVIYGDGNNHLVLSNDHNDVILNGSTAGNGTFVYRAARAQTLFRYYKDPEHGVERINAVGPLAVPINVMIERSNRSKSKPRVIYEFWAPVDNDTTTTSPRPANLTKQTMPADDATGMREFNKKPSTKKRKIRMKKRSKSSRRKCRPCKRSTNMVQHFCASDFVLDVLVLDSERRGSDVRHELRVTKSFRNSVPIHAREFVWTSDSPSKPSCSCPKLVSGYRYVIMGNAAVNRDKREVRLVIDDNGYVRQYGRGRARKLPHLARLCGEDRTGPNVRTI